jgi:hypothetical protein
VHKAFERGDLGGQCGVLGLDAVDVVVQDLDLARRDVGARDIVDGRADQPGVLLQDLKHAAMCGRLVAEAVDLGIEPP